MVKNVCVVRAKVREVPRVRRRGFASEGVAMYAASDMSRGKAG